MQYRPELDGVRAIAVAAVILAHAGAPLPGGHLGVDIFFVLSGYLITGLILRDLAAERFSLGEFYVRRARRLLPSLAVVMAACLPAAWLLLPPGPMEQFGQGLVALTVFATNILFWLQSGYFAPAAAENPLIHTWSLAVEEQFYLAFPLLLMALWGRVQGRARLGWILAAIGLASLAAFAEAWGRDLDTAFYLLPFRAWELMAGALVAWFCHRYRPPSGDAKMASLGFAMIAVALGLGAADPVHGWVWSLAAAGGTVLILLYARPGGWPARALSLPPLRALGLISYSAYLWHQPVLAFGRLSRVEPLSPVELAGLVALTLLLASATWALVEQPFRRAPPRRPWGLALVGGAAAGLAGLGLAADLTGGLGAQRFAPGTQQLFATAAASPARDLCHGSVARFRACIHGADVPPEWAVIGDSHAVEIAHELGAAVGAAGGAVLQINASACPPAMDTARPCGAWLDRALTRLAAEPEVKTVVLVWRHGLHAPDAAASEVQHAAYWAPVRTLIARLQAEGRAVIVTAPVPELPRHVDLLLRDGSGGAVPALTRAFHDAGHARLRAAMEALPAHLLDPADLLCDQAWCYAARDGTALYFDDDHLSLAGARVLVPRLLELADRGTPLARRRAGIMPGPGAAR